MTHAPARRTLYVLLALAALSPLGGCRKKVQPVDTDTDAVVDVAPPAVELQLAEVSPAQVGAGASAELELFGSGFVAGAKVTFSGAPADGARVVDANTMTAVTPGMAAGTYDVTVTNPDGTRATLRGGLSVVDNAPPPPPRCNAATVSFGFDAAEVSAENRPVLQTLAACLAGNTATVVVEGHCDDRGTTEYNLALGQRRADAVQRTLVSMGVPPSRIRTVSYGEERPKASGGDESAWAANRRAEVVPEGE
jgi:peptidoglycan-associated lipoprotein